MLSNSAPSEYRINLDAILETALLGFRRAAVFMGLGLNAALDPEYKAYQLPKVSHYQLMPDNLDDNKVAEFKGNFAAWVVGNGLREVIESFAVFLDQLHVASLRIAMSKEALSTAGAAKKHAKFGNMGLKGKLKALRDDFGITTKHLDHLCSIQKMRTCLTHRRGIVGREDCNQDSELAVKWMGIDFMAVSDKDGHSTLLDLPLREPVLVEAGDKIVAKVSEHALAFPLGSVVKLEPKHIAEMCVFVTDEAKALVRSTLEYAKSKGIEIEDANQSKG